MSTESSYHFDHLLQKLSLNSDFIHIFHVFPHVYTAPGQGRTTLCGQNSDVNRKASSLCPFVASFKNISLKSDFIQFFSSFIHVYSPGPGAGNALGSEF